MDTEENDTNVGCNCEKSQPQTGECPGRAMGVQIQQLVNDAAIAVQGVPTCQAEQLIGAAVRSAICSILICAADNGLAIEKMVDNMRCGRCYFR